MHVLKEKTVLVELIRSLLYSCRIIWSLHLDNNNRAFEWYCENEKFFDVSLKQDLLKCSRCKLLKYNLLKLCRTHGRPNHWVFKLRDRVWSFLVRVFVLKLDILYIICCILLFQNVNLLVLFLKKEQFIQKRKQKGHVKKKNSNEVYFLLMWLFLSFN